MATLIMTIDCDSKGNLSYDYPAGCPAVELGIGGVLQLNLGTGYNGTCQFDNLAVVQGGTSYTLDLTQKNPQPVNAVFPDGADMLLNFNLRVNMSIENIAPNPSNGEDDLDFTVVISDGNGQHTLDPEIRVRSGTSIGAATWAASNVDSDEQPDVVVRKSEGSKELRG